LAGFSNFGLAFFAMEVNEILHIEKEKTPIKEVQSFELPAHIIINPSVSFPPSICMENSNSLRMFLAEQTSLGLPMIYSSVRIK
jgi:hypothetical protein